MRLTIATSVLCAALLSASCGTTSPAAADIRLAVEPDVTFGVTVIPGDGEGPFILSAPPVCLTDASGGPVTITRVTPNPGGIQVTDFTVVPADEHASLKQAEQLLAVPGSTLRSLGYPTGKTVTTACPGGDVVTIEARHVSEHTAESTSVTLEYRKENGESGSWSLPFQLTICAAEDEREECETAVDADQDGEAPRR